MFKRNHLLAWLGFVLVTMLMYPGVWLGQNDFYHNDIVNLNLPQRQIAAEIWLDGEIPLWNRYSFGGQPFLAAIQAGILYPLNAVYLFLPPNVGINVSNLLHQILAGGFMYLFLYSIWRKSLPAWVGGMIFMSSGFMAGHVIHTQMMNAVIWIPLVLYFLDQLRIKGRIRYALGLTLTMVLQILSGHPQVNYYTGIFILAYFLYTVFHERKQSIPFLLKSVTALGLAGVMTMMQLLPTVSLIKRSFREAVSYEFFSYLPLTPGWLAGLLIPFRNGGGTTGMLANQENWWELTGYVGIIAAVLAIAAGMKYWKRDWYVPLFAGIGIMGLFVALGDVTGASKLLYHVPIANMFRVPGRFVLFFDIAAAVLTCRALVGFLEAEGAELAKEEETTDWWAKIKGGAGPYLVVIAFFLLAVVADYLRHTAPLPRWVWAVPAFWLLVGAGIFLASRKWPFLLVPGLVAFMLWDSVSYVRTLSVDLVPPVSESRIATLPGDPGVPDWIAMMQRDPERFRIASFHRTLGLDRAGRYQLEAINGYDSLFPEVYEKRVDMGWSWSPVTRNRQIIDLLNVKYVIAHPEAGISQTVPGVPSVKVPVPAANRVDTLRFTYHTIGPKNRAPYARVIVTAANGSREVLTLAKEIKLEYPKRITDLQVDFTEWRGAIQISSVDFISEGTLVDSTGPLPTLAPPWKEVYRDASLTVYENLARFPRYWMTDFPEDPRVVDTNAAIQETDYKHRESTVQVTTDGGWLVMSQLHDPGWVAYVDGVKTPLQSIGVDLTAVPVDAGTHTVRFRYEPREWTTGLGVSAAGFVGAGAWLLGSRRKKTF